MRKNKNEICVFCTCGDGHIKHCEVMNIYYHSVCLEIEKIGYEDKFYDQLLATMECARN